MLASLAIVERGAQVELYTGLPGSDGCATSNNGEVANSATGRFSAHNF